MAFLLDDLLLWPINLVKWMGDQVLEAVAEPEEENAARQEMLLLRTRFATGEITLETFEEEEERLLMLVAGPDRSGLPGAER